MKYFFYVNIDRETPEHAGAGGLFQVINLRDGDDSLTNKEGTDYMNSIGIDAGQLYSSLDDLRVDIANGLKTRIENIELSDEY